MTRAEVDDLFESAVEENNRVMRKTTDTQATVEKALVEKQEETAADSQLIKAVVMEVVEEAANGNNDVETCLKVFGSSCRFGFEGGG